MPPTERPPFTFIVGSGRSGTTLVRAMVDSHPEIAVSHEAQVIPDLAGAARDYGRGAHFRTGVLLDDLYASARFRTMQLPRDELEPVLQAARPGTYADAIRSVWGHYASRQGKHRYGDKTPGYVLRIPLLAATFPEARFLHVIRDGRDSALSYLDRNYGPRNVARAALRWRDRVRHGRTTGRSLGPGRYRELRYEDLIADPPQQLEGVCAFLGVPYSDAMVRYHERADDLLADTPRAERFEHLRRPPTTGLRDWRRDMQPDDVALYDALAGDLLRGLGYEASVGPAWRIRGQAAMARLTWQPARARESLERRRRRRPGGRHQASKE